jgi:nicotinamide mononucleotide transporter
MIEYLQQNWIEVAGIITSVLCVWFNTQQNIWGWFWAIVASGIYAVTFYQSKLYSDMELQLVFIVLSIYGWYEWKFGGKQQTTLTVSKISMPIALICLGFLVIFTLASGYFHSKNTDASIPYMDSFLTAMSLVATWMAARKYIENWSVWIVANIFYVGVYFSRELYGTSILYFILILLPIKGIIDWRKSMIEHQ